LFDHLDATDGVLAETFEEPVIITGTRQVGGCPETKPFQ
jgi:hypothetical protein